MAGTFGAPSSNTGMSLSMAERSGPVASVTGLVIPSVKYVIIFCSEMSTSLL